MAENPKRCKRCRKVIEERYTYCHNCWEFEQNLKKFYSQIERFGRLVSVG